MKRKDFTIWWAFIINVILFNLSIGLHPLSETGDDDVLMAMVSGCFGEPTAHIIFVNVCWAAVIRLLILLFPGINWYFVLQYFLVFTAFFTIAYVILKLFGEKKGLLLSMIILLPYAYEGYVVFQFTKTAGILTAAGCFYLYYYFREKMTGKSWIFGMFLAWLGSCYRFAMSAAVAAVCIGSMLGVFLINKIVRKEGMQLADFKQKSVLFVAVLLLGMVGLRCMDNAMYSSKEWQEYKEYNYYRGTVRDFPIHKFEGNEEAYAGIGITETEYKNLMNWNIADPEVYTTEKLKEIGLLTDKNETTARVSSATVSGFFQFLTDSFVKNKMFLLFWMLSALLLLFTARKKRFLVDIFINFSAVLGVNAIFYLRGRYGVNRVDICIWLAAILMLVSAGSGEKLQWIENKTVRRERLWNVFVFFCFCITVVWLTGMPVKEHLEMWKTEKKIQADYQEILKYVDADEEGYYFMDACAAHYGYGTEWYQPYAQNFCKNLVYLGGWYTNSPVTLEQWKRNKIQNPFRDMCRMENAYIVDRYQHIDTTISYLQEHYSQNLKISLIYAVGDYKIYRIWEEENEE